MNRWRGSGMSGTGRVHCRLSWPRFRLAAVIMFVVGTVLLSSRVWTGEFDEYAVKAAYLYNFAKYAEWPPEAFASVEAPLVVCIAGENPFGGALATLRDKTVDTRPVEVRMVPVASGLESCHVVFIGRAEQGQLKVVLTKLAQRPILTVSDISGFARAGGMIGLVEAEQRIRFEINLEVARRTNLKLSSQLLKLAIIVQ